MTEPQQGGRLRWSELKRKLLDAEHADHGFVARIARRVVRSGYFVALDFHRNRCVERAATLSYVSILSLIPLSILFFSFAGVLGLAEWVIEYVEANVLPFVAPEFQDDLSEWLELYVTKDAFEHTTKSGVGFLATVSLIPTALAILATAERCFNRIFRSATRRTFFQRFAVFWVVLTTSPFLLIASTWVTDFQLAPRSSSESSPVVSESVEESVQPARGVNSPAVEDPTEPNASGISLWLRRLVSLAVGFVAFTVLYLYLPSTSVRIRSAAVGGLLASVFWETVKSGFYVYVAQSSSLYGQLGIIPLFLVWLYVSWLVVLVGCEAVYVHQNLGDFGDDPCRHTTSVSDLGIGLFFLERLARSFVNGASSSPTVNDVAATLNVDRGRAENVVSRLAEGGFVDALAEHPGRFALRRAPGKIELGEIADLLWSPGAPEVNSTSARAGSISVSSTSVLLQEAGAKYREMLGNHTVADLLEGQANSFVSEPSGSPVERDRGLL